MAYRFESSGVHIKDLDDFGGTLKELQDIIQEAIKTYGEEQIVRFDAGANNVQVILLKEIKKKAR